MKLDIAGTFSIRYMFSYKTTESSQCISIWFLIKEQVFYLDHESDHASDATWTHFSLYSISIEAQSRALITTIRHNARPETTPKCLLIPFYPHSWKNRPDTHLLPASTPPQLQGFNPPFSGRDTPPSESRPRTAAHYTFGSSMQITGQTTVFQEFCRVVAEWLVSAWTVFTLITMAIITTIVPWH